MIDFLEKRVTKSPTGCWLWNRGKNGVGYGSLRVNGTHLLAHRFAYEICISKIPKGMHVLHKCDVPACCNPAHLFLGTNQDNIADSVAKGRRKGLTRNRPHGLKYNWTHENKAAWIERKRKIKTDLRELISKEYKDGGISQRQLARKYSVSQPLIYRITQGL